MAEELNDYLLKLRMKAAYRLIREAGADQAVLTLKSFEALEKVADGQATKIIIPSELQNVAGLVKAAAEIAKD